jgi:hypothetical protein
MQNFRSKFTHIFIGFFLLTVGLYFYLFNWQNPQVNRAFNLSSQELYELIKNDQEGQHKIIDSMNYLFDIHFIENMNMDSLNPYFPAIYIINNSCNAWLHLVQTDSKFQPEYQKFIDCDKSIVDLYPFYTKDKIFVDQPHWGYSFFSKPLSYWIGHAWAIELDEQKKTIKCVGGISWGYRLFCCSFKPTMILPTSLTNQDWQTDWKVFQQFLPDYQDITKQLFF